MIEKRIWSIHQSQKLTNDMDCIIQQALSHHQVQINMILVAELDRWDMTFNYNYIENYRKVDFQKLLSHTLKCFKRQFNSVLCPEYWVHISKIAQWKYLVIHRDIDFWDIVWWQHTQRAIHLISNKFYQLFPLDIKLSLEKLPQIKTEEIQAQKSHLEVQKVA